MSVIPAFFAFLAVICMFFYNLDGKKLAQVQSELLARKGAHA
jgi:GPH family glycoside/pentoside/hexuronide:cation symporter